MSMDLKKSKVQILPLLKSTTNKSLKAGSKDSSSKNKVLSEKLTFGQPVDLIVELALSNHEQEKGLMYRKSLAPGYGMLFIFPNEQPRQFWMKNTLIPLSIAFIDEKKTIFQISDMDPVKTLIQKKYDRAESIKPAKFVLEVPQGWFLVNKIGEGSILQWKDEKKYLKN
jgi:hypothetical protein